MEFTGTAQAAIRTARIRLRDEAVNQPNPSGESQVSPEAMVEAARAARAGLDSPARGSRADVDTAIAAATLPPTGRAQGTDRTSGTDGARTGAHRTDRGRGDGPARGN